MAGIEYNKPERDGRSRDRVPAASSDSGAAGSGGNGGGHGDDGRGAPAALVCPGCGRSDEVRAVQAVFLDGHRHVGVETGAGSERRTSTREVVSRLAQALAPAPPKPTVGGRGCLGVFLVVLSVAAFMIGSLKGHWFTEGSGPEGDLVHLAVISPAALLIAVLLFGSATRVRRAFRARTEPGLAAAERLWLQGWYCARCAKVHFEGESEALTLQEFRVRVWTAGGYGDLARTRPAVDFTVAGRPAGS
ncbi:hypothetical protein ACWGDE_24890 [Streptomyces sp. NPDC054956]